MFSGISEVSSANEVAFVDAVDGANLYARAATGAEGVIDGSKVVLNGDSALRTGLLTLHTADTTVGAVLTCESTLILVGALHNHAGGVVDKVDDTVGTLAYADAAADTLAGVNVSYAVFNGDGVLRTNSCAVAVAEAGVGAVLVTAVCHVCGETGLVALIVALSGCSLASTVAGYESNLLDNVFGLNAEDGSDTLCGRVTAGHAEVGLVGGLFSESLCIAVTSGVAASATVSAGETVTDSHCGLILLDCEEYAGQGEECRTYDSDADEDEGRNKNRHITTPFLRKQVFHHACKAEECKSYDGSCYESNGNTAERLGRGTVFDSGTNSCEEYHCEKEAETNAERGNHGLDEVVLCGDVVKGYAENRAVGSDEREVHAERLVKRGDELLEHYLYELNESCDNENEYDSLKVLELEGHECVSVDRPGCRGSAEHYEGNCDTHTGSLIKLLGYAKEGANSEELLEYVVVDENARHENEN